MLATSQIGVVMAGSVTGMTGLSAGRMMIAGGTVAISLTATGMVAMSRPAGMPNMRAGSMIVAGMIVLSRLLMAVHKGAENAARFLTVPTGMIWTRIWVQSWR